MKPDPVVSVIVPTYNRRDLILRALASVLDQSYANVDVLVIDDNSTDGTMEVLATLDDPRVRVVWQERNQGQSAARNLGISLAHGELIAFQDSDDEWMPEKLVRQVEIMRQHPELGMVYGDLLRLPRHGESHLIQAPNLVRGRIMDGRNSGYAGYGIGIQSCLIRAGVFRRIGGFNERMHCLEDLEFFLRFNGRFTSMRIPEPLVRYHESEGVSKATIYEHESRKHLLRRFWWPILRQRPSWFLAERDNLRHRRRLDL